MSGLMQSVANIFRPTQQVTVAPTPTLQQANPTAAGNVPVPPSGTSSPTPPNPMDEMAALWQNDPKSPPQVDPLTTPLFNTDPAKIAAAAAKIDFLSQVPQEVMAKAMSGTDPGAFMQVMNYVAQRTLATSTQLNAATIEQATTRNNDRIQNALPTRVRQIQLDAITPENPVLAHPASQPLLQMVRSQIQMKQPGISAAEVNRQAEAYLTGFAGQLVTPQPTAEQVKATSGTDWDAWANNP